MASNARRIYWDTSCFICFLNRSKLARREICEDILRNAKEGNVILYTSTLTIAEVIYPKRSTLQNATRLTPDKIAKIAAMFRWKWLKKIDVHQLIAFRAVDLSRDYNLLPSDSIHAATAIVEGVDALQRWDRDFSKVSHLINVEDPTRITTQSSFGGMLPRIGPHPDDFGP